MDKKIKIIYKLSEKGQKKAILEGKNGKKDQVLYTDATEELLYLGNIDSQGELAFDTRNIKYDIIEEDSTIKLIDGCEFDCLQTEETIIDWALNNLKIISHKSGILLHETKNNEKVGKITVALILIIMFLIIGVATFKDFRDIAVITIYLGAFPLFLAEVLTYSIENKRKSLEVINKEYQDKYTETLSFYL